jgi:hypothetical protein
MALLSTALSPDGLPEGRRDHAHATSPSGGAGGADG